MLSYVEKQSLKRTFVSIAEDVGLNEKTIRNIFRDYINYLEETFRFVTPNWLGIDKIHIIKPRCVLTNIEERTLLDILPNRNKETVVEFLSSLPNKGRIQYFTMDMWKPYKDAVKAVLPKATIIVDKFHVVRLANLVLESIHKQLRENLSATERRGLMHDRLILLKRHKELTEMDKITLDLWTKNYPILGIAYTLKESFFDIWDCDSRQMAFIKYNDWKAKIPKELQSAFEPLIEAMMNWEEEIFAYFDHRIVNDYTESLNSLFRVINRLGRGYSFEALRAQILFTEALAEDCKPEYQKRPLRGTKISTLIEKLEKGEL
ncbi:ISL3 family transposase [Paenibacillus faecis]|nr:ISL3 family transposase [Paenibacillus faecis]